jgi:hypothetical protein
MRDSEDRLPARVRQRKHVRCPWRIGAGRGAGFADEGREPSSPLKQVTETQRRPQTLQPAPRTTNDAQDQRRGEARFPSSRTKMEGNHQKVAARKERSQCCIARTNVGTRHLGIPSPRKHAWTTPGEVRGRWQSAADSAGPRATSARTIDRNLARVCHGEGSVSPLQPERWLFHRLGAGRCPGQAGQFIRHIPPWRIAL